MADGTGSGSGLDGEPAVAPLVEPDQGWIEDDEAAVVATEAVGDVGPLSAEEAAIHIVGEDEAPGLTWRKDSGYLDET